MFPFASAPLLQSPKTNSSSLRLCRAWPGRPMQGGGTAAAAAPAARAAALPEATDSTETPLLLPAGQLHVPWSLGQYNWDPNTL